MANRKRLKVRGLRDAGMLVPRSFMRLCKLTTPQFRVLCNGLSYPSGWTPARCVQNTGMSIAAVRRHVKELMDMGYLYRVRVRKDASGRKLRYRFTCAPSILDEKRPWYQEMLEQNEGDLDGVSYVVQDGAVEEEGDDSDEYR